MNVYFKSRHCVLSKQSYSCRSCFTLDQKSICLFSHITFWARNVFSHKTILFDAENPALMIPMRFKALKFLDLLDFLYCLKTWNHHCRKLLTAVFIFEDSARQGFQPGAASELSTQSLARGLVEWFHLKHHFHQESKLVESSSFFKHYQKSSFWKTPNINDADFSRMWKCSEMHR